MTDRLVIARETAISVVINAIISIGFFLLVFSYGPPVPTSALAPDFLPQTFMVALMGSLVPSLLVGRRNGAGASGIVRRAFLIAIGALLIAGGGAFATAYSADAMLSSRVALAIKAVFGALLAAIVTPIAVRATLQHSRRS
jgi:hypothetical protein